MPRLITDPVDIKITDGVLQIVNGDLVLTRGVEAVAQQIEIACKIWRGEWFANAQTGMPYDQMLGAKFDAAAVQQIVREMIASVDSVLTVNKLIINYNPATRTVEISYSVSTQFGTLDEIVTV